MFSQYSCGKLQYLPLKGCGEKFETNLDLSGFVNRLRQGLEAAAVVVVII